MIKKVKKWFQESDTFEIVAIIFILFGIIVIGFAIYWGAFLNHITLAGESNPITNFSEFIGGIVGSFWSLAGVLLFYASLTSQKHDLEAQKDLLVKQIDEIVAQTKESRIQNEMLKEQKNEETFFQLLKFHNEILQNIAIETSEMDFATGNSVLKTISGRKSFVEYYDIYKRFFQEASETISGTSHENLKKLFDKSFKSFFVEYQADLGHYFRNLFNVLLFVDNLKESVQPFYLSLIKSQLSNFELALLLFHCLTSENSDFKKLVEKNALLSTVPQDEVTTMAHVLYEPDAFGDDGFGSNNYEDELDTVQNSTDNSSLEKDLEATSSFLDKIGGFSEELNKDNKDISGIGSIEDIMSKLDNITVEEKNKDIELNPNEFDINLTDDSDNILENEFGIINEDEIYIDIIDNDETDNDNENKLNIDIDQLEELTDEIGEDGEKYENEFLNTLKDNFNPEEIDASLPKKNTNDIQLESINPDLFNEEETPVIDKMSFTDIKSKLDGEFESDDTDKIFLKEDIVEKNKNSNLDLIFDNKDNNDSNNEEEDEFSFTNLKEKLDSDFESSDNTLLNKSISIIEDEDSDETNESSDNLIVDDSGFSLDSLYDDEFIVDKDDTDQELSVKNEIEKKLETDNIKIIIENDDYNEDNKNQASDQNEELSDDFHLEDLYNSEEDDIIEIEDNSEEPIQDIDIINDKHSNNDSSKIEIENEITEPKANKTIDISTETTAKKKKKIIIKRNNKNDDNSTNKPKGNGLLSGLK